MTTPVSASSGATAAAAAAKPATPPGGALGKDAFMQLLVAQMRYQNPMSPVDGQQYMAQLAQFAQVEKLDAIVKSQTDAALWQKALGAQSMLGKDVTTAGPDGTPVTATVTSVTFTPAGPRLALQGGTTIGVDDVTSVATPRT